MKVILMVPVEKYLIKGKWTILNLKMIHPLISASILQILILLNERAKIWKKILLTVLITVAFLKRVILKFRRKKRVKIYTKNLLLVFSGKKSCFRQFTILDIICTQNWYSVINPGSNLTVLFLSFYNLLSSEGIGKRVQNNFPKCIGKMLFVCNALFY